MDKRAIILVVTLFILIVAGMFFYAYLKRGEIVESPVTVVEKETIAYPEVVRIDAKHYFIDGKHTFVGEIQLPTPCDLLEAGAVVMESFPEQIRLNFKVINNAQTCAQVVTAQRFKVSAVASVDAAVSAMFMDREVQLNLIPAAAGETPEEFELFIKG
jgi:hypothetical protein